MAPAHALTLGSQAAAGAAWGRWKRAVSEEFDNSLIRFVLRIQNRRHIPPDATSQKTGCLISQNGEHQVSLELKPCVERERQGDGEPLPEFEKRDEL